MSLDLSIRKALDLAGIELEYNKKLQGTEGTHIFYADAARRLIRLKEQKSNVADGMGLVLTIDSAIQSFAYTELLKQYKAFQAESAVAIVMDPYTGAILAMVCLPDFEPEKIGDQNQEHLRNRALTDPYEPGSIFKPVVAAIAIDGGAVSGNTVIFCENGTYSGKGFGTIGEYNNHHYGNMTVQKILEESSNIGMAKIGQKMGKKMLYDGLKEFRFRPADRHRPARRGNRSSVADEPLDGLQRYANTVRAGNFGNGPADRPCVLHSFQRRKTRSALRRSRPLSIMTAMSSISSSPDLPAGVIIKPEVAKWMVEEALAGVVNEGTGKKAALKKWQVYGKTGTANIAKTGQKGFSENEYVASFVGGAPASNPKVVVLVSIRKPNRRLGKGYTGGTVAAPVVAGILDKTLTYLKVPPDILPEKPEEKLAALQTEEAAGGF